MVFLAAACLMTGCNKKAQEPTIAEPQTISMDQLSFTLPEEFTPVTVENKDLAFMYSCDDIYIYGYQENKQELMKILNCSIYTLDSYVQSFADNISECVVEQTENCWTLSYADKLNDMDYTFVCAIYETEENFWRLMGCCPTESFEESSEDLWEYVLSAQ